MAWTTPTTQTTGTLITAALWNQVVTDNLNYLKANTVPAGIIMIADAACPSGWTRFAALDGKFIRGNASYGATGGAATHTHTGPNHTHTVPDHGHTFVEGGLIYAAGATQVVANNSNLLLVSGGAGTTHGQVNGIANAGAGTSGAGGTGSTSAADNLPAYINVIFCQKDA